MSRPHIWTLERRGARERRRPLIRARSRRASKHHYTGAAATITSLPHTIVAQYKLALLLPLLSSTLLCSHGKSREGNFLFLQVHTLENLSQYLQPNNRFFIHCDVPSKTGDNGCHHCPFAILVSFCYLRRELLKFQCTTPGTINDHLFHPARCPSVTTVSQDYILVAKNNFKTSHGGEETHTVHCNSHKLQNSQWTQQSQNYFLIHISRVW